MAKSSKARRMTLGELADRESHRRKSKWKAYMALYEAWREGRLEIADPHPPLSFPSYLFRPDYSTWFWVSLVLLFLSNTSIPLSYVLKPSIYIRYLLGSLLVLFLPGYSLIEALYPKRESLSPLERLALSIGLSLALVPLEGLLLNYTPFGISLGPVLFSLDIFTISLLLIGALRKYLYVKLAVANEEVREKRG